ncbi:alpha-amylase family glycosyl hydrolase [Herbiconiux moechotypicola]|uniref:Glycosyl hydrolase family 13 catalytic domain-containing protein n=1 Tax=Herbiconiux moechotypicola TaxID=637393 RepID=A0ABP5Q678_9MICO|nr:alpha-amylase family glycosyl hydrolase [Herbiconiux moechotypicola]MCS5728770.1 alpha-amylase family glycosyl hydrolase [Herbiconiux moechotypicola]
MSPTRQRARASQRVRRTTAVTAGLALCATALTVPALSTPAYADPPVSPGPLAEGDVIYQVLVDRFKDGDPTNNDQGDGEYDPDDLGFYHGGDWAGLTEELDYIAGLGVTAIWLSPVSEQQPLSRDGLEASYHGYFTKDFATPNEHFGDTAELQELIDTAHGLGLKMILDAVPNHTADYLAGTSTTYSPSTYKPAAPLDDPSYFHHNGDCLFNGLETQTQIENCDLGGLDDLDQSDPDVNDYLMETYKDWVDMGFDGIRVDAARSVPKDWLEDFETEMGVPTFGEVFVGDVDYVSEYQDSEWGVLDFPYFFTVREAFSADTDMNALGDLFDQDYKYSNPNRLETFLDNHDRARFLTWADDNYQRLRSGLTFLLTSRGVPVIYYGTEQADDGNGNPYEVPIANKDNRKDMTTFDDDSNLYNHIQRLTTIKAAYPALQVGTQREMWSDTSVYGFSRRVDTTGAEAITLSSNSWSTQTRTIPLRSESSITVGTVLTNLMNTSDTVTVTSGGVTGKQISVSLGEHESKVYAPGTPVSSYSPEARNTTKIRVHYNVGLGHSIAIRGDEYPFTWTAGRGARNVASDVWEFEVERIPDGETFEFKALIDDTTWSTGSNFTGTGGDVIDVYPTF